MVPGSGEDGGSGGPAEEGEDDPGGVVPDMGEALPSGKRLRVG